MLETANWEAIEILLIWFMYTVIVGLLIEYKSK
jgi:hypothetical protein